MNEEKHRKEPFEDHAQRKTGSEGRSASGRMPPPAPAASDGGSTRSSLFVEVDHHTASRPSTEESSITTILTLQRMKKKMMQQMENEIEGVIRKKHQEMQQQQGMPMVSTSTEATFEEHDIEKLEEQGNGRKWFYDSGSKLNALSSNQQKHARPLRVKKEDASANIEHPANEIIFLTRGEVDRMKRSIEEMKKEQVAATGKFEETIEETSQKFEELRSLVTNSSAIINHRPNLDVSHARAGHSRRYSQRMFVRTPSALLESHESISFDWDTFSLMMISPVCSKGWILGFSSFSCQMTLGVMILIGQFKQSEDSSIFGVPFKVDDPSVRVAQFLSIIICLLSQSDILTSIRSFLLLGKGSNWLEVIGEEDKQASRCLWITRVVLPNTCKLSQGLVVTFASFVITVQNKDTIDLLKDVVSLMVVSEFDNILFNVTAYGYLGEELQQQTEKITDGDPIRNTSTFTNRLVRENGFVFVRLAFFAILSAMLVGWGIVFRMQRQGKIFNELFPECGMEHYQLAFEEFGDEKCYGGPFNNIKCKYEDGDCASFNTAFPSCNGEDLDHLHNVEKEVANGKCNMTFAIEQCEYDGGDCCPYDIQQSVFFGDGKCNGGSFNTEGCLYDLGDCISFNQEFKVAYPDCDFDPASILTQSSRDIIFGDGICDGGRYNSEQCGFEYGDCEKPQIGGDVVVYHGVNSANVKNIEFNMWMSADASQLLVEMPQTNESGEYDLATNGMIAGHKYNSTTLKWVHNEGMDTKERLQKVNNDPVFELHRMAVAGGNGTSFAVGSPLHDNLFGSVAIFDFWGRLSNHQVLTGEEQHARFGYQVDLIGTHIAVSSPMSNANGFYRSGKIQIFKKNSEEVWTQVGNDIIGKIIEDRIGFYYVGLNSSDGTRVFFSAAIAANVATRNQLKIYQFDSPSQEWIELATDTPIFLRPYTNQKDLITISADGNRFAVSSYNHGKESRIVIYNWTNARNGGSWNQLGPPISPPINNFYDYYGYDLYGNKDIIRTNIITKSDGFGRSISMNDDGTLLAISAVDPKCDGRSRYESNYVVSTALCGTGSIQLYQYKPTNPPWRPFTRLPHIRGFNSQRIMDTPHQEEQNIILGLQVSLRGDGSVLAASGFDIDGDFGFVKVFNVTDLFYVDCLVENSRDGIEYNEKCNPFEPYYTKACGYSGNRCPLPSPVEGLDDCKVANPWLIGNGECVPWFPYSSKACNYDGGDCGSPEPVEGYPNCLVLYPDKISNGFCDDVLPYNSYECGFDGGDCNPPEFPRTSFPTESIQPSTIPSTSPSASPTTSVMPSPNPSSHPSAEPSTSVMPTTMKVHVKLELLTPAYYPEHMSWSLIDNSQNGAIVHSGPGDGVSYERNNVYSYIWTLNRCNIYTFTIYDSYDSSNIANYGDFYWSELPEDARKAAELLGYNGNMWNNDKSPKLVRESEWDDLTNEQQAAATSLGYTACVWSDDDNDDDDDFCYSRGYAEVRREVTTETLGRIDGDFGSNSTISIYICDAERVN